MKVSLIGIIESELWLMQRQTERVFHRTKVTSLNEGWPGYIRVGLQKWCKNRVNEKDQGGKVSCLQIVRKCCWLKIV